MTATRTWELVNDEGELTGDLSYIDHENALDGGWYIVDEPRRAYTGPFQHPRDAGVFCGSRWSDDTSLVIRFFKGVGVKLATDDVNTMLDLMLAAIDPPDATPGSRYGDGYRDGVIAMLEAVLSNEGRAAARVYEDVRRRH